MKAIVTIFLIALLLTIGENIAYAGTTGKLTGVIKDEATKEVLIGANIVLKGTSLGASTDIDGNYVILNIPPGKYTVVVSIVGYRHVEIDNVQINTDLTTAINATLQPEAVEVGAVMITAERPLVRKDNTSSLSTVSADEIKFLPVNTINQLLQLDAGIVMYQGRVTIRGGRSNEVGYQVDGISTTDEYNNTSGITVENSSIQELQVVSGTFNAEYGQAMSGIVNIVTKQGEKHYTAQVTTYGGAYLSNDNVFSVNQKATLAQTADQKTSIADIKSVDPMTQFKSLPIYDGELALSGPIPYLSDLTFFANGRYFHDEGYFFGSNWFRPDGAPGDSSIVAMNPLDRISLQGKLTWQMNSTMRLTYNGFLNHSNRPRNYFNGSTTVDGGAFPTHDYKYDPYALPQNISNAYTQMLMLSHVLSSKSFYELRVSRYYSQTKQYVYDDPTATVKYLVSVTADPTLGVTAEIIDPSTSAGLTEFNRIKALSASYTYIADPNGPDGYIDPSTFGGAPASLSFRNKGMDVSHFERSTANWIGKLDFTSQIYKAHEVKMGAEMRLHELTLHSYNLVAKTDDAGNTITPWEPMIAPVGNTSRNDYDRLPKEFSAYIQDKIEYKSIIVNFGLRFDYFDPNANTFTDPRDPNIYAPFKYGHIYAGIPDSLKELTSGYDDFIAANGYRQYTPDERRSFMQKSVSAKMAFSPRLGIAFPITDRGIVHFSYGHFFQMPDFQYLYQNPDFKLTSGTGAILFGNPDLKPQRTTQYEIGFQQQLSEDIGLDATLFYRDVRDWVGTSPYDTTAQLGVYYSLYENKDYENVRGIVLKFDKRFSNSFSVRADYTYQVAEGTYSNPTDQFNAGPTRPTRLTLTPLNFDQRHTINAQFLYVLSNWTFSLIGRYWSGQPYTPTPLAEGGTTQATGTSLQNTSNLPAQKSIDLTIDRSFHLSSTVTLDVFLNVYNLLDQRDATAVYTDTGSPDYTTLQTPKTTADAQYNASRVGTVEDFYVQPSWYTAPRQVQIGLSLGFN